VSLPDLQGHDTGKLATMVGPPRTVAFEQTRGAWAKSPADRAERPHSAEPSGQHGNRTKDLLSVVPPVAAEHLVRSLSGEHHLDLLKGAWHRFADLAPDGCTAQ